MASDSAMPGWYFRPGDKVIEVMSADGRAAIRTVTAEQAILLIEQLARYAREASRD